MSPVKIVKNPDGSMQRAAMTQVGLCGICTAHIASFGYRLHHSLLKQILC